MEAIFRPYKSTQTCIHITQGFSLKFVRFFFVNIEVHIYVYHYVLFTNQGLSQQCKCDDCLLGITDILAEVALLNLKIQRTTCTSPKNGSEDRITGEDCGDNCCTNYPQNGGDDTDCNVLIRKVSKKLVKKREIEEQCMGMRYFVMILMGNRATQTIIMLQNLPYLM